MITTKKLEKLIKEALDIANDLCYDDKCKADLQSAHNELEISNILKSARSRKEWRKTNLKMECM